MADHVFICYARDDQDFVFKLAVNLKERGVSVWLDQWDIEPGANWNRTIDEAIFECARFLIVLSPEAVESIRVEGEWVTALEENKSIVPVLYRECRIPSRLRLIQHVDFTNREPDDSTAFEQVLRVLNVKAPASPKPEVPDGAEEAKEAAERTEEEVVKGKAEITRDDTFIAYSNGVVLDKETDLEWVAGPDRDMTWYEAKSWVESLTIDGGGWRMPTDDELEILYKEGAGTRNMTPFLKTTGWWVWASEERDSSTAWYFDFHYGHESRHARDYSEDSRAFSVRSRR